ncbi:MAG: hypothetical protein AAGA27_02990, partial [Pseudomonadota bacterium]
MVLRKILICLSFLVLAKENNYRCRNTDLPSSNKPDDLDIDFDVNVSSKYKQFRYTPRSCRDIKLEARNKNTQCQKDLEKYKPFLTYNDRYKKIYSLRKEFYK